MDASPLDFRLPFVEISTELRWMLLRAFGPQDEAGLAVVDGDHALRISQLFGTSARIAARHEKARLTGELGSERALEFTASRLKACFSELRVLSAADRVAEIAARLEIPLVFLKFVALHHTVGLIEGSRPVTDVDVLAPEKRVHELHGELIEEGWQQTGLPGPGREQHLPTRVHPTFGAVEVHRVVLGVGVGGSRRSATVEALEKSDLLIKIEQMPGLISIPQLSALVAHVMVHGLVQHGPAPFIYPQLRMIADLVDLGIGGHSADDLLDKAKPLVATSVAARDLFSIHNLCRTLAQSEGDIGDEIFLKSPEGVLLRHIQAGRLSTDYEQALKTRCFVPPLSDASRGNVWRRTLMAKTFLSRDEAAAKYDTARTVHSYMWTMLVVRPIDVIRRWSGYSASWLRERLRHHRE